MRYLMLKKYLRLKRFLSRKKMQAKRKEQNNDMGHKTKKRLATSCGSHLPFFVLLENTLC